MTRHRTEAVNSSKTIDVFHVNDVNEHELDFQIELDSSLNTTFASLMCAYLSSHELP